MWPLGALARNPFRRLGDLLHGPGVADMKGGLAVMIEAIRLSDADAPLSVVLTVDEELGSPSGRRVVESVARHCTGAIVFEPGRPSGALVDSRRGSAVFKLTATGKTAHAGNDPERGINAIDELAHQLLKLIEFRSPAKGTYVMAGVISGGTARQVVPDRATAAIDVRARTQQELDRVMYEIVELAERPHIPGIRLTIEGGETRPPFRQQQGWLKERFAEAANGLNTVISYEPSGGGSDGNFTASLGLPTLDGVGPTGRHLCSWEEVAGWESGLERVALVASVLDRHALG